MLKQSTSSLSADATPVQTLGTGQLSGDLLTGTQAPGGHRGIGT